MDSKIVLSELCDVLAVNIPSYESDIKHISTAAYGNAMPIAIKEYLDQHFMYAALMKSTSMNISQYSAMDPNRFISRVNTLLEIMQKGFDVLSEIERNMYSEIFALMKNLYQVFRKYNLFDLKVN